MRNISRFEKYFFLLMVLLHLLPVLLLGFFVTHDGPSHVYNSYLISRLLHGDAFVSHFYQFNPYPVPNWLGHALLCLFDFFTAGNVSERILLGLYIIGLPYSFRSLLLTLKSDSHWASWLIFPFIYNLIFYLGFYNFCIGIPVLFYSLSFFVRHINKLSAKNFPVFVFAGILMYFSHLFILSLFILASAICLLSEFILSSREKNISVSFRLLINKAAFLALSLLPCIFLTVYFISIRTSHSGSFGSMPASDYFKFLLIVRPLITLRFEGEQFYSVILGCAFWFMFIYLIAARLMNRSFTGSDMWLFLTLIILSAYFFISDDLASGQFVTLRMLLFFFLFSLAWIGINSVPRWLKIFSVTVFTTVSLWFLNYHYHESKNLSSDAEEYISCAGAIEEGSTVFPIMYPGNVWHANFFSYPGTRKNIIVLDNYEAEVSHFPLLWKPTKSPYAAMNIIPLAVPCMQVERYETITGEKINYIIRSNFNSTYNDSCSLAISNYLGEKYVKVFTTVSGNIEVFKRARQ